ncbi:MAG: chemotaxis protein CheA [Oscillospiraceae bacterium]|nr:chemotaxis protein CheA [Oscillospiraceae bacterium]
MSSGNEILDMYIYETNTLLEQLESSVLEAEKANDFSQDNVNEIFRIMHTIKGSSAMMEFDSLATIAHRIEDLFFLIRENSMSIVSAANRSTLFDLVFQSIDYFRGEVEKIESDQPLSRDIDKFLSDINSLISKIKAGDTAPAASTSAPAVEAVAVSAAPVVAVSSGNREFPYELRVFFDEGCGMENLRSFMLVTSVRDCCADSDFIFTPEDVETNTATSETVIENGFYMMFRKAEDRAKAISVVNASGSIKSYQAHDLQFADAAPAEQTQEDNEVVTDTASANAPAQQQSASVQHPKESLISVNLSKLEQLTAVVGEIVITESMVTSSPDLNGLALDNFQKSARQLRKLTDELQDVAMSLRMVPISGTFQKMNRIVRDMSKKLGKRAKLTLIGENTEVDKTIVDSLGDPLMHIVRNSMDHGLEDNEADRIAAGKDPVGEVTLTARDTGSEVIIEIKDDGRGVNCDAVLKKAIKNGIASPDVEYSKREILNFLMMPGFSTNSQVTEFSGRGVGMDVVKKNIEEVGGTVTITSEEGQGMTTTLKIPLTMAIMDGMEVSVGDSIFTIPINNIRQSFKVTAGEIIYDSTNREVISCLNNFYPIIRAKELYQLQKGHDNIEDGILLWLESGECSYCLFVDDLLGEQQVVVKQLPSYVNSYNIKRYGINGCTLLGDGSISIILDVANLYASTQEL